MATHIRCDGIMSRRQGAIGVKGIAA